MFSNAKIKDNAFYPFLSSIWKMSKNTLLSAARIRVADLDPGILTGSKSSSDSSIFYHGVRSDPHPDEVRS